MNKLDWILLAFLIGGCSQSAPPSPTPSATRSGFLEQARQQFQAGKFDQSSASASLALEVAREAKDNPAELECRCLMVCSQAHLSGPFPLKDLKALQQEKGLTAADRQRLEVELKGYHEKWLAQLKTAEQSFADKKYQQSLDDTQEALNHLAALEDRSQDGAAKFRISKCYQQLGDKAKAQDLLEEAARAQPPSSEAVKLLAATKPKAATHSGPIRGADGSIGIISYGGVSISLNARNQIKVSLQGESDALGIAMTRQEWETFKTVSREMQVELDKMQRSRQGGGTSRVVQNGYTVDMVICVGTYRSYGGWETRSSEPEMELWLINKLGSSTPWRANISGVEMMIRQVDNFLKTAPPALEYDPRNPVPPRLAGKWTGSTNKPYEPGFEVWFTGSAKQVTGTMVWQGEDGYATLSGPLQDRLFTFVAKGVHGTNASSGYLEVDNERGATFKGVLQEADGAKYTFSGSR